MKSYENIANMMCTPFAIRLAKEICVTNFLFEALTMTMKVLNERFTKCIYFIHFLLSAFCSEAEGKWTSVICFNICFIHSCIVHWTLSTLYHGNVKRYNLRLLDADTMYKIESKIFDMKNTWGVHTPHRTVNCDVPNAD